MKKLAPSKFSERTMALINRWLDQSDYIIIPPGDNTFNSGAARLIKIRTIIEARAGKKKKRLTKDTFFPTTNVVPGDIVVVKYTLNIT